MWPAQRSSTGRKGRRDRHAFGMAWQRLSGPERTAVEAVGCRRRVAAGRLTAAASAHHRIGFLQPTGQRCDKLGGVRDGRGVSAGQFVHRRMRSGCSDAISDRTEDGVSIASVRDSHRHSTGWSPRSLTRPHIDDCTGLVATRCACPAGRCRRNVVGPQSCRVRRSAKTPAAKISEIARMGHTEYSAVFDHIQ